MYCTQNNIHRSQLFFVDFGSSNFPCDLRNLWVCLNVFFYLFYCCFCVSLASLSSLLVFIVFFLFRSPLNFFSFFIGGRTGVCASGYFPSCLDFHLFRSFSGFFFIKRFLIFRWNSTLVEIKFSMFYTSLSTVFHISFSPSISSLSIYHLRSACIFRWWDHIHSHISNICFAEERKNTQRNKKSIQSHIARNAAYFE